jgi:hypothetical protein
MSILMTVLWDLGDSLLSLAIVYESLSDSSPLIVSTSDGISSKQNYILTFISDSFRMTCSAEIFSRSVLPIDGCSKGCFILVGPLFMEVLDVCSTVIVGFDHSGCDKVM